MATEHLSSDQLRNHAVDLHLAGRRLVAATGAAQRLVSAGRILCAPDRLMSAGTGAEEGTEARDDVAVGVGTLALIAGELLGVSSSLLAGDHHYAGAALLRQIVEVEYLAWAFAHQERDAAMWLHSTHQERRELFSPAGLRRLGNDRFVTSDYQHHCEQGGHPVPGAVSLLDASEIAIAQLLLVDLLLHAWRTTDSLLQWANEHMPPLDRAFITELRSAQSRLATWGRGDPLYEWSLTAPTSPPPT